MQKLILSGVIAVLCCLAIGIAVDTDVVHTTSQMESAQDRGLKLWRNGKWEEAAKHFEAVMLAGQSLQFSGKSKQDIQEWWGNLYYNYGGVKKDMGDIAAAQRYWDRARIRMSPQMRYLIDFSKGTLALQEGSIFECVKHFTAARVSAPQELADSMGGLLHAEYQKFQQAVAVDEDYGTLWRTATLANTMGQPTDAILDLYNRAVEIEPEQTSLDFEPRVYFELGTLNNKIGRQDKAVKNYRKFTQCKPNPAKPIDPTLLGYGFLALGNSLEHKSLEDALILFKDSYKVDPSSYRAVVSIGRILSKLGRDKEAYQVYEAAVRTGTLNNVYQHPGEMLPGLTARPWHDVSKLHAAHVLEEAYPTIRAEVLEAIQSETFLTEAMPDTEELTTKGTWSELNLFFQGMSFEKNIKVLPKTSDLILNNIPEAVSMVKGSTKLSLMKPGTVLKPHSGPTNGRIRIHLGIEIPEGSTDSIGIRAGNETKQWENGKCIAFDDSFEHTAWNYSPRARLVLIVDIWHPEMDEKARMASVAQKPTENEIYSYHKQRFGSNWFNSSTHSLYGRKLLA